MSPLSVAGKHAIITGAGSGISLAFARLLLSRGCSVLIGDLNLRLEAQQLLKDYPHDGSSGRPSALFQKTDVTSWRQLSSLFSQGVSAFKKVDIICPGAGLFDPTFSHFWHPPKTASNPDTPSRDSADADLGTYTTLNVNVTHPIRLSQLGIGYWTQNKMPGTLVHISSVAGHAASVGTPIYYASKHAIHGFVRSLSCLRDELNIRVGAVAPGGVMTPMLLEDSDKAKKISKIPGEDILSTPEHIAEAMLELVENPDYGNGTILEVTPNRKRLVPLYNLEPPLPEGIVLDGFIKAEQELVQRLKKDGLST
ncbi:short chain dehydrogenase [Xylariales sp. PMI_506]|nr:short chain dehydrogenase [Xylariales sp. PMI_506]